MSVEKYYKILTYFSACSLLVPISISLAKFRTLSARHRLFFVYLLICLFSEAISFLFIQYNVNVNYVLNVFTVIEAICLCSIFYFLFTPVVLKLTVIVLAILYFLFSISNYYYFSGIQSQDDIISTVESVLMILLSCSYFYRLLVELNVPRLESFSFYWINLGIAIYFSASFFLFMFGDFLNRCEIKTAYVLWSIHLIINIACNSLFSIGIWKASYK